MSRVSRCSGERTRRAGRARRPAPGAGSGAVRGGSYGVMLVSVLAALAAVAVAAFGAAAVDPARPDSPGARALAEIASFYHGLESYEAQFEQTRAWAGMEGDEPALGTLYLKRPNRFRIEYQRPEGHLQVADGEKVWTWVPESGDVLVAPLAPGTGDLLRWILENSRADSLVGATELDGGPARVVGLHPEEGTGLSAVTLFTRPGAAELLAYELIDSSGNRTLYRLLRTRKNPRLADELFRFTPPPGAPVVEVGAP